jgi:hypothetical protein
MLACNWPTKAITVPKTDLTLISGTRYSLAVEYWFQLLRELNGGEDGIAQTVGDPLFNNTPPTSGTPRIVNVNIAYSVEFEDGLYSIDLQDGNTNIRVVEVKNQVSVGTNNVAGTASGDADEIAIAVWDYERI